MSNLLNTITELSHEFGTNEYVKGGGGNTSCKDAGTLWVKPSGTTLAGLQPATFVAMDRARLGRLYELTVPADKTAREALVKEVMMAAVVEGQTGRPSVEAPLHDTLSGAFVVHTHPALVNGLTCARDGEAACRELFPDALWVPYIDPGFTLCMDVHRRIKEFRARHHREPNLLILQNHGIFVSANSADEVRATYRRVMQTLRARYAAAGIETTLKPGVPAPAATVQSAAALLREVMGDDGAAVEAQGPFAPSEAPFSPDHIVYSKSFAYVGAVSRAGLEAFRARYGYWPRVVATPAATLGVGPSPKRAQLALEFALDGALVGQLTRAFGGPLYLTDAAREFVENWEVESYRSKQVG